MQSYLKSYERFVYTNAYVYIAAILLMPKTQKSLKFNQVENGEANVGYVHNSILLNPKQGQTFRHAALQMSLLNIILHGK